MRLVATIVCFSLMTISGRAADAPERSINPPLATDIFVPLVIVGEGWSQQIVVKNVDTEDAMTGTLKFFSRDGEPWKVDLVGRGASETFFVTLLPGQMEVYETVVQTGGQQLGFAQIDVDCCPYALTQTIFRKQTPGRPDLMTSVAIDDDSLRVVHIPFDSRDGKYAGVGILTTDECYSFRCETALKLTFKDERGNVFREVTKTQKNQTLNWFSLSQDYPEVGGRLGSLEISSGDPEREYLSAVGFSLQFAPNGAFTAVTTAER